MSDPDERVLRTSIRELEAYNTELQTVFERTPIPLIPGTIFRLPSEAYENWGIDVTPENREFLETRSESSYRDYFTSANFPFGDAKGVLTTALRRSTTMSMISFMAHISAEALLSIDDGKREFNFCSIGERKGTLISAVVQALRETPEGKALVDRTTFWLVDFQPTKLESARQQLEQLHGVKVRVEAKSDDEFLADCSNRRFDLMAFLSFLHHKSFLSDYLLRVKSVLTDDAALVMGDWHSMLWYHPTLIYKLLSRLGVDHGTLDDFRVLTNTELAINTSRLYSPDELSALELHMEYIIAVVDKVRKLSLSSPPRVHFLDGNDTSRNREKKLVTAGFECDPNIIRAAFPRLKVPPAQRFVNGSDFARVITARKRAVVRA